MFVDDLSIATGRKKCHGNGPSGAHDVFCFSRESTEGEMAESGRHVKSGSSFPSPTAHELHSTGQCRCFFLQIALVIWRQIPFLQSVLMAGISETLIEKVRLSQKWDQFFTILPETSPMPDKSHYGPSLGALGRLSPVHHQPLRQLGANLHSMATPHGVSHGGGPRRVGARAGHQPPAGVPHTEQKWYDDHFAVPCLPWSCGDYPQTFLPHIDLVLRGSDRQGAREFVD